jgi:hypothetical protein
MIKTMSKIVPIDMVVISLVMHEKSQQNDDRQWDADEPKE